MISITFTNRGNRLSLRLEGHAGYAEHGNDIVCASASILAYTVAQFVMEAEHNGDLESPAEVKLESGDTIISCEPTEDLMRGMADMYQFAKLGFCILEHNYPQYVRLTTLT